jgi:O-acetylhomoserine/O-acetylserine sulfhydrylase-like pyridoxal-dependent enzyme
MNLHTKAVHAGDRKRPASAVPVTTPVFTAASYRYEMAAELDRVLGREETGPS